jgi:Peptidase A4 family
MITNHRLLRPRTIAAPMAAVAVALGGGFAFDTAAASAQTVTAEQAQSTNWSGYVDSSAGESFSTVSGSWVQPSVSSSSAGEGYAAFWVGLGGASNQSESLEQVGTAADVVDGQTTYYAWYELVPAAEVKLPLTIHAGDHMSGKVTVNGTTVTISLTDQTTGQATTKTLQMSNPDSSSAEWIAEAPSGAFQDGSMQTLPLADFGTVTFTSTSATAGGHTGSISDPAWTAEQVSMDAATGMPGGDAGFVRGGPGADQMQQSSGGASAGALSGDGSSFTVTYATDISTQSQGTTTGVPGSGYSYSGSGYGDPGGGYPQSSGGELAYGY